MALDSSVFNEQSNKKKSQKDNKLHQSKVSAKASASMLHISALILAFSIAECCATIWLNSLHIQKIDV